MKPITQTSEQKIIADKLSTFLDSQAVGARLSWLEIEMATGVRMNSTGRSAVRRVLRRLKREYLPEAGTGIELTAHDNAIHAVRLRDKRIGGAVKRARRASKCVATHLDNMTEADRQEYLMRESLRNALATGSSSIRRLAKRPEVSTPELPASSREALERRKVS